ncbi:putative saposin B type domain-containing protein [Helianthus annuus]|nr:putative saposin B type domain-containing protein [Helianthus annuus]KAJ0503788.1 putative saposin B type domain-containing protein [Helianthus annuus]
MVKFDRKVMFNSLFFTLLLCSSWIQISYCSKPAGIARKDDIPFIKCQVCEKLAKELHEQIRDKQDQISPKKISEYDVIEISENVCNLKKREADWMLKIDIVEKGDRLELVEQDSEGQCGSECKTIERACQEVIGYYDTDVAEYIYKKKPMLSSLVKFLCKDLTNALKACNTKPPPVPKGREPGEVFVPKSAKEAEMEKMLKSMEGMPGAPGMKMYSREELMSGKGIDDEDADDEDDEEEQSIPSNLGKILREKENNSKKVDWKQKITKGIKNVGEATKKHATKMAFKLQKWWKAKKATFTQPKSKSAKVEL